MDVSALPHLNATLNGISTCLLLSGFYFIKSGDRQRHKAMMLSAVTVSAAFLASYLTYHANAPIYLFRGVGLSKIFYYAVLISHVVLAAVVAPMILVTLLRALKGAEDRHRKLARFTFPIWLYVSVTGIVVYLMLYVFNPPLTS